jgi:hypothetical protein
MLNWIAPPTASAQAVSTAERVRSRMKGSSSSSN